MMKLTNQQTRALQRDPDVIAEIDATIKAAGVPIDGVSWLIDTDGEARLRIDFRDASKEQKDAAAAAVEAWTPAPRVPRRSNEERIAELETRLAAAESKLPSRA